MSEPLPETVFPPDLSASGDAGMGKAEMRESFDSLKEASDTLALNVEALNHTLQAVNALQIEQARQRKVQEETERNIDAARAESELRDARTRRIFTFAGLALAILLPLVSILVYSALIHHVNELLDQQKSGFYNTCITRNNATNDNIRREQLLAQAETNPKAKAIHTDSAQQLSKSIINCGAYLK